MPVGECVLPDYYPKEFLDYWQNNYNRCFNNEAFTVISTVPRNDGLHYFKNSLSPLKNEDGKNNGAVIICTDVTQSIVAEEQLKLSELKYKSLFDNTITGFSLCEVIYENEKPVDWKYLEVNTAFENILNVKKENVENKNISEIFPLVLKSNIEKFCNVAISGNTLEEEFYSAWADKYYHLIAWKHSENRFAINFYNITQEVKTRKENEINVLRINALFELSKMDKAGLHVLLDFLNESAISITQSKYGYIYYYSEQEQQFTLYSWSNEVMPNCKINDKKTIYQLEKTGIWGEVVRQRKPIIVNNFQAPNGIRSKKRVKILKRRILRLN